jgi:hypothetical protein
MTRLECEYRVGVMHCNEGLEVFYRTTLSSRRSLGNRAWALAWTAHRRVDALSVGASAGLDVRPARARELGVQVRRYSGQRIANGHGQFGGGTGTAAPVWCFDHRALCLARGERPSARNSPPA